MTIAGKIDEQAEILTNVIPIPLQTVTSIDSWIEADPMEGYNV